ncbi:MAG: hypothetical protein HOL80_03485, partial [Candidatus Magasanikbacteria bacterium]|nr:hypothetical protein [Candidatus Magasanikbacteria bacterium]
MEKGGKNIWHWVGLFSVSVLVACVLCAAYTKTIYTQDGYATVQMSQKVIYQATTEEVVAKPEKVYAKG